MTKLITIVIKARPIIYLRIDPRYEKKRTRISTTSPMSKKWAITCKLLIDIGIRLSIFVIISKIEEGTMARTGVASNAQVLALQNRRLQ